MCHWCWAMAAGLICQGDSGRKVKSWEVALAAYNKGKITIPTASESDSKSGSRKKMDMAIGWLAEHCKAEQGHTQQTTVDDAEHLQGVTRVKLREDMNAELGQCISCSFI